MKVKRLKSTRKFQKHCQEVFGPISLKQKEALADGLGITMNHLNQILGGFKIVSAARANEIAKIMKGPYQSVLRPDIFN